MAHKYNYITIHIFYNNTLRTNISIQNLLHRNIGPLVKTKNDFIKKSQFDICILRNSKRMAKELSVLFNFMKSILKSIVISYVYKMTPLLYKTKNININYRWFELLRINYRSQMCINIHIMVLLINTCRCRKDTNYQCQQIR